MNIQQKNPTNKHTNNISLKFQSINFIQSNTYKQQQQNTMKSNRIAQQDIILLKKQPKRPRQQIYDSDDEQLESQFNSEIKELGEWTFLFQQLVTVQTNERKKWKLQQFKSYMIVLEKLSNRLTLAACKEKNKVYHFMQIYLSDFQHRRINKTAYEIRYTHRNLFDKYQSIENIIYEIKKQISQYDYQQQKVRFQMRFIQIKQVVKKISAYNKIQYIEVQQNTELQDLIHNIYVLKIMWKQKNIKIQPIQIPTEKQITKMIAYLTQHQKQSNQKKPHQMLVQCSYFAAQGNVLKLQKFYNSIRKIAKGGMNQVLKKIKSKYNISEQLIKQQSQELIKYQKKREQLCFPSLQISILQNYLNKKYKFRCLVEKILQNQSIEKTLNPNFIRLRNLFVTIEPLLPKKEGNKQKSKKKHKKHKKQVQQYLSFMQYQIIIDCKDILKAIQDKTILNQNYNSQISDNDENQFVDEKYSVYNKQQQKGYENNSQRNEQVNKMLINKNIPQQKSTIHKKQKHKKGTHIVTIDMSKIHNQIISRDIQKFEDQIVLNVIITTKFVFYNETQVKVENQLKNNYGYVITSKIIIKNQLQNDLKSTQQKFEKQHVHHWSQNNKLSQKIRLFNSNKSKHNVYPNNINLHSTQITQQMKKYIIKSYVDLLAQIRIKYKHMEKQTQINERNQQIKSQLIAKRKKIDMFNKQQHKFMIHSRHQNENQDNRRMLKKTVKRSLTSHINQIEQLKQQVSQFIKQNNELITDFLHQKMFQHQIVSQLQQNLQNKNTRRQIWISIQKLKIHII